MENIWPRTCPTAIDTLLPLNAKEGTNSFTNGMPIRNLYEAYDYSWFLRQTKTEHSTPEYKGCQGV